MAYQKTTPNRANPGTPEDEAPHITAWLRLRLDSGVPIYRQLEEQLLLAIHQGRLKPGETLPAERDLAGLLGISRTTVQRCYNTLRQRRLVRGSGRLGTIVQDDSRLLPMDRLPGFSAEEEPGLPSGRIVEQGILSERRIASIFGLPEAARFLRLVRIGYGAEGPLSYEKAWYSLDAAPFLEDADVAGTIQDRLAAARMPLAFYDQTMEAIAASGFESALFGLTGPAPCLLIKRRCYARQALMVAYVESLFRGDAYTYRIRLNG